MNEFILFLLQLLVPILALMVMITLHEFGHFLAGKFFHVPIYEFAIGMGKELWSKQWKGTKWSIRMLPIGGYCAFDNLEEIKGDKDRKHEGLLDLALDKIPKYQKIIISLAGPFMNIFLAFLITFSITMIAGGKYYKAEVTDFLEQSVVKDVLHKGDKILELNGVQINDDSEKINEALRSYDGNGNVLLKYLDKENNQEKDIYIQPKYNDEYQRYMLGITLGKESDKQRSIGYKFQSSVKETWGYTTAIWNSMIDMFKGKYKLSQMSGIVGTVGEMGKYVQFQETKDEDGNDVSAALSWIYFLTFCSLISINLGIFNLLPLPVLDGGKVFIALIEGLIKKKINQGILTKVTIGSFAVLIFLMIIVTGSDIIKILSSF